MTGKRATMSNYSGFSHGLLVDNVPVSPGHGGKVFWVGNNATLLDGEKGASDGNDGSFKKPFSTLDYAIGQCAANRGDIIYVRPNHTITMTAADDVDVDIAGVSIIGLGNGTNRPRCDYTGASGEFVVGASNVLIENFNFHANVTTVVKAIDIEDGVDYTTIRNCVFDAETTGTDEFTNSVILADNNIGTTIENCTFDMGLAAAARAVYMDNATGADEQTVIRNNVVMGDYSVACIGGDTTASNDILIDNNILVNGETDNLNTVECVVLLTASSGVIRNNLLVTNVANQAAAITADACVSVGNKYSESVDDDAYDLAAIGADDANNKFASTNVVANRDGTILERLEHLLDVLVDDESTNFIGVDDADNAAATTNVVGNRDGSILERLEDLRAVLLPVDGAASGFLGTAVTKSGVSVDATADLFTVTGKNLITLVHGEMTTAETGATTSLTAALNMKTNSVDLCAASAILSDVINTLYVLTGDQDDTFNGSDAPTVDHAQMGDANGWMPMIVDGDTIEMTIAKGGGTSNGVIQWTIHYIPLEASASIAAV